MPELDRRDFLKLVGVSAGSAAAAGCADHVEKLIPYVVQPEEITPGNPVVYASTCTECPAAYGLHVKTREGRPIKLEGNPAHPVNRGKLCARAQASIERTYSPDRFEGPMRRNDAGDLEPISWDEALQVVADAIGRAPAKTHVLGGDPGPLASAAIDAFVDAIGGGGRTIYQPFANEALRAAAQSVYGVAGEPVFSLEGADLVIDFGSEALDTGHSPVEHTRQWAAGRDVDAHRDGGTRLVYVGSRLSVTASASDEWLPARPGSEGLLALALAKAAVEAGAPGDPDVAAAVAGADIAAAAAASDVPVEEIRRVGRALARARSAVALPPGSAVASRRAVGANAAVLVLNRVLGGHGVTVAPTEPTGRYADVLALVKAMQDGKVGVLLVHDANPSYSLPSASGFDDALGNVGLLVSFSTALDETSAAAGIVLPAHAPMESWGDRVARPGLRGIVQPTLRPLFDTRAVPDALDGIRRALGGDAAEGLGSGDFQATVKASLSGDGRADLMRGFVESPVVAAPAAGEVTVDVAAPVFTGDGDLTLVAFPHSFLGDGAGASLPLLQEIPDPVTSVAWDSWAEISLATAERFGVEMGDIVTVTTSAGSADVAVVPRGGIRDDVLAIPTGQGHRVGYFASKAGQGLGGTPRGVNVLDLLPADGVDETGGRAFLTEKAHVATTGRFRRLPVLQFNDNKRGRQLGEVLTLAALTAAPEAPAAAGHGEGHEGGGHEGAEREHLVPYDPADDAANAQYEATFDEKGEASAKASPYRWGMTVDIDKCTGCSACISACYVENNVPRVGEEETRNVRQMAWIRIDRWVGEGEADLGTGREFYHANSEKLGDTDVRNSPMFCQHCGTAPCEPVCPVIATYHNEEGLNGMIYNRCIGTRYCANNCPYKVRRYNYFDNQIGGTPSMSKWPSPMELGLNPDVTVRGQGVMEKCTMCIQRIQYGRQQARNAGHAVIPDGAVQTACQQTCPSDAISFGNLRDDASAVSRKADSKRGYHALQVLNTRPAVTYLSKVDRGGLEG